jgi:hypothetical protein
MGTESKRSQAGYGTRLERAIVLQLLLDDHERMWSREQLMIELKSDPSDVVEQALRRLEREGVVGISEQSVWASSAARHLDELGLIGV